MRKLGQSLRRLRAHVIVIAHIALPCVVVSPGRADHVRGIESKTTQPIAPRDGVLLLPLTADHPGDRWPQTLELKSKDGPLNGIVAWLAAAPEHADRHWTDDPRQLLLRPIQADDDSAAVAQSPTLGPYLLVRLPHKLQGTLLLGKQKIEPHWCDVPGPPLPRGDESDVSLPHDRPTLELAPAPDRPDPVSPFEYWRWTLLAQRMDMNPPAPFGGEVERLAAEHYASLWRIGFERLAKQSQRITEQCRNLLTQTCIDRRQPFAAWVSDPAQASALLSSLLDYSRKDEDVLAAAVAWIDAQSPLLLWPEAEYGENVRLAIATPGDIPLVAKFTWRDANEPPSAIRIEPGVLMEVTIDRPKLARRLSGMPITTEPPQVLKVEAGKRQYEIAFGPRAAYARPPGVVFRPLAPPLTLAEAQISMQRIMPSARATFAQVRRLNNRWEVFIECRRPQFSDADAASPAPDNSPSASQASSPALPEILDSFDDLRSVEAITILLGPERDPAIAVPRFGDDSARENATGPTIWLTIPETGFWKLVRGQNDGTMQIHRKSYRDRWYCRVVLPDSWFSAAETSPALIGFLRGHRDSAQLETGPNLGTPWRAQPSRAAIFLDQWDDLPSQQ